MIEEGHLLTLVALLAFLCGTITGAVYIQHKHFAAAAKGEPICRYYEGPEGDVSVCFKATDIKKTRLR